MPLCHRSRFLTSHGVTPHFGTLAAPFRQWERAEMLECFLLFGKVEAARAPLIAIPAVIAGGVASLWLILSGIKGIITESIQPKSRVTRAANPGRVIQWIGNRPPLRNVGQQ